ncbi:HEAT repeat domain-containing protein [Pyxidicoccus xibeiensis]|uniref:HEAT repeat domain-containing protein n=1 Tax=Pyxidicoccus xibeiensis TaxID=2906759 RepID=UPI0020A714EF|nr:HEAT repeat domain-containing protein [Pyxidicoccus xibeiensis]MCP3135877.1 HEAT repeat domain-containing protein [Pyxidicoccus xibeiensis]
MRDLDPALVRLLDEDVTVRRETVGDVDTSALPGRYALRQALLADEDAEVRATAAQRLGGTRDSRFTQALLDALSDPMPLVRDRAWRALARLGAKALLSQAVRAVREEPVWWVRRAVVRASASVAGAGALEVLLGALEDPFWRVRHAAVQALAWIGAGDAEVQERVRRWAESVSHGPVRSAVAWLEAAWSEARPTHGGAPLAMELHPLAETSQGGALSGAVAATERAPLAETSRGGEPPDTKQPPLVELPSGQLPSLERGDSLGNEDPAVTTARLEATPASTLSARELVEWLGDPHEPLRHLARRRLRERKDPEALLLAMRWLDEPRVPHAAEEARTLLERIDVEDVELASRILEGTPRPGAVAWASRVAVRRGHAGLVERVRLLLRHPEPALRRAALSGLVYDPDSLDEVLEALEDPDETVREEVLAAWQRRPPAQSTAEAFALALAAFAPRASTARERRAVAMAAVFLEDAELLFHAARDEDPAVRAVALRALSTLDLLTEAEREEAATHEDPWLRAAVLDAASAPRACMEDPDPTLRRTALELLRAWRRHTGDTANLLTAVLACTHAPDPWLRARAAELLAPSRSREELRALLRLSLDAAPMIRAAAASSLESCDTLDALLDDLLHGPTPEPDEDLRTSAWTWRLRLADASAFDQLRTALLANTEPARVVSHLDALTLVFPDELLASEPALALRRPTRAPQQRTPAPPRPAVPPRASSRPLGTTGLHVSPLVLSGAHLTSTQPFFEAHEAGLTTFFWEPRYAALTQFLQNRRQQRSGLVVVAGSYHSGPSALRRDVESALRRLRTSWLDVFLLFWVRSPERLSDEDFTALEQLRTEGKLRAFGFSTHLRDLARDALTRHPWPVVMTRHSAAHPGPEASFLPEAHARGTGVLTFTATCYGRLLQPAPGTPPDAVLPTAVDCYRYSLSQPGVSACLTAPRSRRELHHNLEVLARPYLEPDALPAMRVHGERVRARSRQLDSLVRRAPGGPRDALLALLEEDGPPDAGDLSSP